MMGMAIFSGKLIRFGAVFQLGVRFIVRDRRSQTVQVSREVSGCFFETYLSLYL